MVDASYKVVVENNVRSIRMAGCGHVIYMGSEHERELRQTHKSYWCTICGYTNYFPGETDVQKLEKQLQAAREETARERKRKEWAEQETRNVELRRRAQQGVVTRLKNRVGHGVCPCCTRSFADLKRHMTTKHPDYSREPT